MDTTRQESIGAEILVDKFMLTAKAVGGDTLDHGVGIRDDVSIRHGDGVDDRHTIALAMDRDSCGKGSTLIGRNVEFRGAGDYLMISGRSSSCRYDPNEHQQGRKNKK